VLNIYFLSLRIFEQIALALKTVFALKLMSTLLLLLNDKCKLESLQWDGRPGWRFPQTAGCKARACFVVSDKWRQIPSIGIFHQC